MDMAGFMRGKTGLGRGYASWAQRFVRDSRGAHRLEAGMAVQLPAQGVTERGMARTGIRAESNGRRFCC
ncbi:hypothetical protein ACJ72_07740, partial [Emergomyces africanus]